MDFSKGRRERVRKMSMSQASIRRTEEWVDRLAAQYRQERIEKHGGLEGYLAYLENVCKQNGIVD